MKLGMPWNGAEVAKEAERAGFTSFCTGDFVDHDAYLSLGEMARGVTTAEVGTAIAYAFARTPYAHATAARQIHATAPGGMFLGFGTGAFKVNRDWFGVPADKPMARIRELIPAVRAYLEAENGEVVSFEGEYYRIEADIRAPVLGRLDIPLLLAGFNAGMAQTAGEVADGIIGHGLFTGRWWRDVVRPRFSAGVERSGRTSSDVREVGWLITAVDDTDPDRAIRDARRMIAFYLTVKTYDPFVEFHGWESAVEALRAAFRGGDTEAMAEAVTDDMLGAIAVCGTTAQAQAMLDARRGGLPRGTAYLAPPSFLVSKRRQAAYCRASLNLRSPE
ncbi:LLM class flavin-dependent oxidoreductase [Streptomyces iranensis]|uniref:LLM class flavin-dependent oxidoreductase n=1 Tax=Streptomyces iranensis TaxID=576784 RepID=UPI0039B7821A